MPKQRSPYMPGSAVKSALKMPFCKLLYFLSTCHYCVLPARSSPYDVPAAASVHVQIACSIPGRVHTGQILCPECTCLCMSVLFSLCVYLNVHTPLYKNNLEGWLCLHNNTVPFCFLLPVESISYRSPGHCSCIIF